MGEIFMPNLFTLKILYVIILFEKRFILRKVIGMNQILVTKNDKSKKVKEKKENLTNYHPFDAGKKAGAPAD